MVTALSKSQDLDPQVSSDVEHGAIYDESTNFGVDERKLVRKLDLHLVPLVMLLCKFEKPLLALNMCLDIRELTFSTSDTFSFLDRSAS